MWDFYDFDQHPSVKLCLIVSPGAGGGEQVAVPPLHGARGGGGDHQGEAGATNVLSKFNFNLLKECKIFMIFAQ